jgi:hypothetical protein
MKIDFKEKTFEKYFSHEVARLTNITFSPDQCDENFLGFDDAFWLPLPWMIARAPFVRKSRWARMNGIDKKTFEKMGERFASRMPPFRFNLFVQYKRPDFLKTRGAGEWEHWHCPYYRYRITPHQQDVLAKIELQSQGRAATVYASPAFWQADDLWNNVQAGTVIANSNIASVGKLSGHGRYTYTSAGAKGKGHSEATEIESSALNLLISTGLEREALPFNTHIKRVAQLILEVVSASDIGAEQFERARMAVELGELDYTSIVGALTTIELFSDVFGASYLAVG